MESWWNKVESFSSISFSILKSFFWNGAYENFFFLCCKLFGSVKAVSAICDSDDLNLEVSRFIKFLKYGRVVWNPDQYSPKFYAYGKPSSLLILKPKLFEKFFAWNYSFIFFISARYFVGEEYFIWACG